mgnify:CR=1 FL=1
MDCSSTIEWFAETKTSTAGRRRKTAKKKQKNKKNIRRRQASNITSVKAPNAAEAVVSKR